MVLSMVSHTSSPKNVVYRTASTASAEQILASAGLTLSVKEFSQVVHCHPTTAYEMIKRGDLERLGIRVLPLGRTIRIVTADVRRAVGVEPVAAPPNPDGQVRNEGVA